jgi:FMN-dependent NADH-azoreductase
MTTLLKIDTSLYSEKGASSQLAQRFARQWLALRPDAAIVERDLSRDPIPHLSAATFGAFATPAAERTLEQQRAVDLSDTLIEELRRADTIAIGLPMYNFGIPSTLKAYFDHVARAGVTFKYTEKGPQGLLTGKKAYIFATRGGVYAGTPLDTQTSYVRDFLRFIGIADVEFVYAEGLAMGASSREAALAHAQSLIYSFEPATALAA